MTPATEVIVGRRSRRDSGATRFSEEHHHDFDDECWKHHAIINFPDNVCPVDRKRTASDFTKRIGDTHGGPAGENGEGNHRRADTGRSPGRRCSRPALWSSSGHGRVRMQSRQGNARLGRAAGRRGGTAAWGRGLDAESALVEWLRCAGRSGLMSVHRHDGKSYGRNWVMAV